MAKFIMITKILPESLNLFKNSREDLRCAMVSKNIFNVSNAFLCFCCCLFRRQQNLLLQYLLLVYHYGTRIRLL